MLSWVYDVVRTDSGHLRDEAPDERHHTCAHGDHGTFTKGKLALFHAKGCSYEDVGAECGDIDELTCCAAPAGQLFVSVGQDGNWGYSSQNGDACGVILGSNNGCFNVENGLDVISGGSVVGIVRQAAVAALSEQRKVVSADTWFYRNETAKYTLAIDSDAGREYAALEDRDTQVMFITTHGAFSVMKA